MSRRLKLRLGLLFLLIVVLGAAALWLFGPREPVDVTIRFDPASIGRDPDLYLSRQETCVPGIGPQTAKEIVWAYPASRAKTPLALVYVHGFSGDKREMAPVPQEVSRRLGANLYLTRLSGHGGDLADLAEPTANDWLNDLAEAVGIARHLGERVVVIGTSNGGALASWGAALPGFMEGVDGLVLISPNYRINDWRAPLLTAPYGRDVVGFLTGGTLDLSLPAMPGGAPQTVSLPSDALLPMAALTSHVRGLDFSAIGLPALFLYSPNDQIVDPLETERVIQRWGGPSEVLLVPQTSDPTGHMLAGDMFSPATTGIVVDAIAGWIERLEVR
ncbi:alpha/beta hydrolase [Aureimonas populi]|uniref:Alpha/beta hydrolase n=1 Tax=Aureimonas populi TaxID=1701758 RepID=A0ABW5CM54_9HYPH|nr:alpha/beta fold hydrolase [Aureimonas populi]